MKKIIILSVVLILIITACEKKLDIDIPDSQKHIVVNGIINPDSLINVKISKSQDILDNGDIIFLSEADVNIYKNDEFIEKMISSVNGLYTSSVYPEINANYLLTVDYPGLNSVRANNILKPPVNILSIDTVIETMIYSYEGYIETTYEFHYEIKIQDDADETNYYFLALSSLYPNFDFSGYNEVAQYYDSNDPIFRDGNNEFTLDGMNGKVFSDELFNGHEYTINLNTTYSEAYDQELEPLAIPTYIKLLTVSEDIYRYITSYNLNQQTSFDPFAQPVQIYSNIENGLGLFSGYSMYIDSLIINF